MEIDNDDSDLESLDNGKTEKKKYQKDLWQMKFFPVILN